MLFRSYVEDARPSVNYISETSLYDVAKDHLCLHFVADVAHSYIVQVIEGALRQFFTRTFSGNL